MSSWQDDKATILEAYERSGNHSRRQVRINCPLCESYSGKSDYRRSLSIDSVEGLYYCFKCGAKGKLWSSDGYEDEEVTEEEYIADIPFDFTPIQPGSPASNYLIGPDRKLSKQQIESAGLGTGSGRIIVPVRAADDKLLGWVGRVYPGCTPHTYTEAKYIDSPHFPRKTSLYNSKTLLQSESSDYLLVVEGIFDALLYLPYAVACFGKPSEGQIKQLAACKKPIVVALDGDAYLEGKALSDILNLRGATSSWVKLPYGQDPNKIYQPSLIEYFRQVSKHPGQGFEL